jgi:nucleoside-diphosphate-sugar epimerase
MKKNILVTGGAGYIGSILIEELLKSGYKVTTIDNFMYRQSSLNQFCNDPNFNVIKGDIRVENIMAPLLKKSDIVIPLAALVGAPICNFDPVGATTINYDAIKMMIKLLSKDQIVLMPTTNSAYGSGDKNNFCTEESALNPISQYAIEKVNIEKELMQRENSISFRLATVFGMSPRMRIDLLVNDFTYRAMKDKFIILFEGHFKRNYIHVRDVAKVFKHSIDKFDNMKGQVFNVGLSDANVSKKELCEIIKKHVPDFLFSDAAIGKDIDQRNYIVSNQKIESTGFKASITLDQGIIELLKGYRMIANNHFGNL